MPLENETEDGRLIIGAELSFGDDEDEDEDVEEEYPKRLDVSQWERLIFEGEFPMPKPYEAPLPELEPVSIKAGDFKAVAWKVIAPVKIGAIQLEVGNIFKLWKPIGEPVRMTLHKERK